MKTLKQVQAECKYGTVFLLNDFGTEIDDGCINECDGEGYFHDGENRTEISVWDEDLTWDEIQKFPYVCWYNK